MSNVDPTGLWCAGVGYGFSAFGGIGSWGGGIGLTGSVDAAYCSGSGWSAIASFGGAAGTGVAAGGFVGAGPLGFYSPDPASVSQLYGPFQTAEVAGGIVDALSVQGSTGSANVAQLSLPFVPLGAGFGLGGMAIPTYTAPVAF